MKKSLVVSVLALSVFIRATAAYADLVPPGGEGVNACHNKKAGDTCENYVIDESGQHVETGKCVEEKLDHLHFKFKAHLRCVSASVPKPAASAAPPLPSVAPTASAAPADSPAAPAAASSPPAIASTTPPAEAPKSSACSWSAGGINNKTSYFLLLGVGLLFARRRMT